MAPAPSGQAAARPNVRSLPMTKPWYYPAAHVRAGATSPPSGPYRATAGALATILLLTLLLFVVTARLDARPAPVAPAPTSDERQHAAKLPAHFVTLADPGIDLLAGIVARKYRVSEDATREFVRTAYREGARHGV